MLNADNERSVKHQCCVNVQSVPTIWSNAFKWIDAKVLWWRFWRWPPTIFILTLQRQATAIAIKALKFSNARTLSSTSSNSAPDTNSTSGRYPKNLLRRQIDILLKNETRIFSRQLLLLLPMKFYEIRIANFHSFCASPVTEYQLARDTDREKLVFFYEHFNCSEGLLSFRLGNTPR